MLKVPCVHFGVQEVDPHRQIFGPWPITTPWYRRLQWPTWSSPSRQDLHVLHEPDWDWCGEEACHLQMQALNNNGNIPYRNGEEKLTHLVCPQPCFWSWASHAQSHILYVQHVSESIWWILMHSCAPLDIQTCFQPHSTLRQAQVWTWKTASLYMYTTGRCTCTWSIQNLPHACGICIPVPWPCMQGVCWPDCMARHWTIGYKRAQESTDKRKPGPCSRQ